MKKVVSMLIALSIVLLIFVNQKDTNTIIIYSSAEQFRNDQLQKDLLAEFPDLNVRVMYIPTAKSAAKVYMEKERTDADIVLALESGYLNKISDSLDSVEGLSRIPYIDGFKPEDNNQKFVTWERQAGAFVVNKEILEKLNLPMPTSYDDLLDPIYQGHFAMPDPNSSGTGYFFYKSLVNERGEEAALAYFDELEKNVKQFTESGSGPIKLLNQGEIAVGFALTFQAVEQLNKERPFEIIFPEEGSPYSITGTGIVKGRRENPDVVRVFDYVINTFIKHDKSYFSPEKIYEGQENLIPNYPTDIPYANMEGISSIQEKERLLKLWKY